MANEFIGSCISLISNYDIRYEGVLCHLSPQDSTLRLKNVKSYGTEGRKKDGPQIPPGDKVYEYILFRGSDIKDLQVKSSPPTQKEEQVPNDSAIIQSQSSASPSSSFKSDTLEGGYSASFSSFQEPITSANTYCPSTGPLNRSGIMMEPGISSMAVQSADLASSATRSDTQGNNAKNPGTVLNSLQSTVIPVASATRLPYPSDVTDNAPSITYPNTKQFNNTPTLPPEQYPISSNIPYSLPANVPVSPYYSSYPDMSANGALATGRSAFGSVAAGSVHSSPFLSSSIPDLSTAPLSKLQPPLPSLDQLPHLRQPLYSSIDEKDMFAFNPVSANLSSSVPPTLGQHPQLLLPLSAQQPQFSMPEFTEEFDFEAMNEKFKKEEVWGYLGRAKQMVEAEETTENAIGQNFGLGGGYVSASKPEPKLAYKKDEFFDTLSGNVHAPAPRNGQNKNSQRMMYNTETFGSFGQIPPYQGRGFYDHGRGRGWNYRM